MVRGCAPPLATAGTPGARCRFGPGFIPGHFPQRRGGAPAEMMIRMAYGRLCLGDENRTLTVRVCSHPSRCFILGHACGSMGEFKKATPFVSDANG